MSAVRFVEKIIVRKCIAELLRNGFTISVSDGEETVLKWSLDAKAIFAAMFTTDEDRLHMHRGAFRGWVQFIYGNNGWDVINDYTTNLEPFLTRTLAFIDKVSD